MAMKMTQRKTGKILGFSLIELLVVISIIAILVTISVASYARVRQNARDSRRRIDLENLRQALVMYRSDMGCYPAGNYAAATGTLIADDYWSGEAPEDPSPSGVYTYAPGAAVTCADGVTGGVLSFTLEATLENGDTYTLASP